MKKQEAFNINHKQQAIKYLIYGWQNDTFIRYQSISDKCHIKLNELQVISQHKPNVKLRLTRQ